MDWTEINGSHELVFGLHWAEAHHVEGSAQQYIDLFHEVSDEMYHEKGFKYSEQRMEKGNTPLLQIIFPNEKAFGKLLEFFFFTGHNRHILSHSKRKTPMFLKTYLA